jgi:mRNA biogenesis factor
LEKINRKKAEYVAEHPEQRRLVYRPRRKEGDKVEEEPVLLKRNLFDKNGLPRHPERSVYYDPVMNPFGVAPPGMPFMQRGEDKMPLTFIMLTCSILAPLPGEVWSDEETDDGWSCIRTVLNP